MSNHPLLISCHGCGHVHEQWPGQLSIDSSLTIYYHCYDLGEGFHHTLDNRRARIAMNVGVPLVGIPDTAETLMS